MCRVDINSSTHLHYVDFQQSQGKFHQFHKGPRFTFQLDVPTAHHSGDQIKNTSMGRACSMRGGQERCIQGFSGKT
jgi:hypothetical protein